jgi:hypothetical protein
MWYYRVAAQVLPAGVWRWETTTLTTPEEVISFLVVYRCPAPVRLRVFSAPSIEALETGLTRATQGDMAGSLTAEQFLREQPIEMVQRAWLAAAGELPDAQLQRPLVSTAR